MKNVDITKILIIVFGVTFVLIGGLFVYQSFIVSSRPANQQTQKDVMKEYNMLDQSEMLNGPDTGFPAKAENSNKESMLDTNQILQSLEEEIEDPTVDLQSIEQELQRL